MNRVFALLLALTLTAGVCPAALAEEDPYAGLDITWLEPGLWVGGWMQEGLLEVYDERHAEDGSKVGYINRDGQMVIPAIYDEDPAIGSAFSQGLAWVCRRGEDGALKYGFIDKSGQEVIPLIYDDVGNFSDGLAPVYRKEEGKWGAIDLSGELVIPFLYDEFRQFCEGRAIVRLGDWETGKYGYVDTTGRVVIPIEYDDASDFSEGLAQVYRYSDDPEEWFYGYLDLDGIPALSSTGAYSIYLGSFAEGLALIQVYPDGSDGPYQCGFIDKSGQMVIPAVYDEVGNVGGFFEGRKAVGRLDENGEMWYGFLDQRGEEVIPLQNRYVDEFSNGLAAVGVDTPQGVRWGCMDKKGRMVVPAVFEDVSRFREGVAIVQDGERCGLLKNPLWVAHPSSQTVEVDGVPVEFPMYAVKDENGYDANYVRVRDLAQVLSSTAAQFNVEWDGAVNLTTRTGYTSNGSELSTPFSGSRAYTLPDAPVCVDGEPVQMEAIVLTDDAKGGYTYYKLRDLGQALGFYVDWDADRGVYLDTDKR